MAQALWKDYSFSDKDGARRFLEFLDDLKDQSIEIDEEIKNLIIDKGWKNVFGNTKNFANPKAVYNGQQAATFLYLRGNKNTQADFNSIVRTKLRGSGTYSTQAKEASFLICVNVAEDFGIKDADKIVEFIDNLQRVEVEGYLDRYPEITDVKKVADEIISKPGLKHAASNALNALNALNFKIKNYQMHRESPIIKKIRDKGSKLSGLAKDKWCPADVYLINYKEVTKIESLLTIKELTQFNEKFTDLVDSGVIIPISLKADAKASMGAVSTKKFAKIASPEKWDNANLNLFISTINEVIRFAGVPVSVTINEGPKTIKVPKGLKSVTDLFNSKEFLDGIKDNVSWQRCYPPVIEWLVEIGKSKGVANGLVPVILEALSASPLSTKFYICTPDAFKIKEPHGVKIEVQAIELQLNTTSVLVHYRVEEDGKITDQTAQIRTKGSVSQLITYDSTRGNSNYKLLVK